MHGWVCDKYLTKCVLTTDNSLEEVCSHVAAVLFKVKACIRLGLEELTPVVQVESSIL